MQVIGIGYSTVEYAVCGAPVICMGGAVGSRPGHEGVGGQEAAPGQRPGRGLKCSAAAKVAVGATNLERGARWKCEGESGRWGSEAPVWKGMV